MNTINTYGHAVFKGKTKKPLHIVAIYSEIHIAFSVFDNAWDAKSYILDECNNVKYNPDFDFDSDGFGGLLKSYVTTNGKYIFKGTNNQLYIRHARRDAI